MTYASDRPVRVKQAERCQHCGVRYVRLAAHEAKCASGNERFYDRRLSWQENKAVEMLRNGFARTEIADELEVTEKHLSVLFYTARKKGVDVPKIAPHQRRAGNPPKVSIERILEIYDALDRRGYKGDSLWQTLSERTQTSVNCLRVRLWRHKKGIRPKYAEGRP